MLSTAATTNTGPSPFGPFALLAKLARGDLADLFLARRRGAGGFEKLVVIKRLHSQLTEDPELVELFLGEARVAAHIDHPNVRRVHELGEVAGQFYIAVEYLEGVPLMELLLGRRRSPKLADHRVLTALVAQACEGLYAAHARADSRHRPVVHGDLNPRSLFVTSSGYVKILDFDIVEMRGTLAARHGFVQRTCAYMAPEQVRGGIIDARSDIFSLGVVAWEAVTGRRLFKQTTREQTIAAIDRGVVPPPSRFNPAVSELFDDAILRALAHDAGERFATAREFGTALDKAALAEGPPVTPLAVEALVLDAFAAEIEAQRSFVRRARTERDTPLPELTRADSDVDTEAETRIAAGPFRYEGQDATSLPGTELDLELSDDGAPEPLAWQESASFVLSDFHQALGEADDGDGEPGVVTLVDDDDSGVIVAAPPASSRASAAAALRASAAAAPARRRPPGLIAAAAVAAVAGALLYMLVRPKPEQAEAADRSPAPRSAAVVPAVGAAAGGEDEAERDAAPAGDRDAESAAEPERAGERDAESAAERRERERQAERREREHQAERREREQERRRQRQQAQRAAERQAEREQERQAEREQERRERERAAERQAEREQERREREQERRRQRQQAQRAAEPGYLTVDSTPYATVFIDGVEHGYTPLVKTELPAGVHRIELVSSAGGQSKSFRVDIAAGETVRRKVSW